jgi:hypothetical protein
MMQCTSWRSRRPNGSFRPSKQAFGRPPAPEFPRSSTRELVEWISAWLEIGETFTAERLAAVPDETLTLYLSQVAIVTTAAMWGFERSTEIEDLDRIYAPSHDEMAYGPYVASARQPEDWETLRGSLDAMWLDAPERLLHLFAQLSGDESMLAPQQNRESSNNDVVSARDSAQEQRGYVTASGARAFLAQARSPLEELLALSDYDLETRRHLAGLASDLRTDSDEAAGAAGLHTALEQAGLLELTPQRLLLAHEATSQRLPIVKLLQALAEKDPVQFNARGQELAYLVSVLIAGIAVDGATLNPAEARNAALATCNLGLETLLPERVAESFVRRLKALRMASAEPRHEWLVEQAEVSVADLHDAVGKGDFEAAREAALALGFVFEPRTCRAVMPLLDELPRLGACNGGAVTWIDSLAAMASAAQLLRGIVAKARRGA